MSTCGGNTYDGKQRSSSSFLDKLNDFCIFQIHWIMIPFARNPVIICIARLLAGAVGGSCFTVIPVYVTEVAQDRLRSTLGTFLSLSLALGMLIIHLLGYFLHYVTVAWIMAAVPAAFIICFSFNPESPQFLAKFNITKAEKALRYYRGISLNDITSEDFQLELTKLCKPQQQVEAGNRIENVPDKLSWKDFGKFSKIFRILIKDDLISFFQFIQRPAKHT